MRHLSIIYDSWHLGSGRRGFSFYKIWGTILKFSNYSGVEGK